MMAQQESTLRIPVATFLHGLVVMAGAFGAYYVSSEISPIRMEIAELKEWRKSVHEIDSKLTTQIQVFQNEHKNMADTIHRHHETDLVAIQGLQAQINDLRNSK